MLKDASSFAHISFVRMYQSQSTKMISGGMEEGSNTHARNYWDGLLVRENISTLGASL